MALKSIQHTVELPALMIEGVGSGAAEPLTVAALDLGAAEVAAPPLGVEVVSTVVVAVIATVEVRNQTRG
jgi:hypothetical protein